MERPEQKHILVLITNPFAVVNMIHSGLTRKLAKYYRISVMSDLLTQADVDLFNEHFHLDMRLLKIPFPPISRFTKWLRAVQMLLFGHYFSVETIRIKLMEKNLPFYRLFALSRKSRKLIALSGSLTVLIRNWLIRRTMLRDLYTQLAEHRFRAVLSTSPFDLRENIIANSLKAHGIPCISTIISWDNLTSKGIMNTKADVVLTWNKAMAIEYHRFYAMFGDEAEVRTGGVPRFDLYFRNSACPKPDHINAPETNTQTRTILFSTGAVKHHICQNHVIEDLLEYAESRTDIVVLVRCHPGDDPGRYHRFRGAKNLRFFQPFDGNTARVPPVDYLEMLHFQLTECDVCVQVASTMFLDAAACNKPCISIAYDAHSGTHYRKSARRFYDYSHQLPLHGLLKEHMVYDRRELFGKLDEILESRNSPTDLRHAIKPFIHCCGPDAARRTTRYIHKWLG